MRFTSGRAWFVLALCSAGPASGQPLLAEPIRPLEAQNGSLSARAALGRALFHDVRLSRDNNQTCAGCHQLARGGADGLARALGTHGKPHALNTPSIYNSTLNFRQTWTGRYQGIERVLDHVLAGQALFASPWQLVVARLTGDQTLSAEFTRVYGQDVNAAVLQDALGQYLASLTTPSRFDRFLRGDKRALSYAEQLGYARFKSYGCVSCHQGVNVGGNMYQKFGAMRPPAPGAAIAADPGRFAVTGREADRHMFRVPSLRNVALTGPYFHNGSVATLEEAVDAMFKYQLGRSVPPRERDYIIGFLKTLSGESMPPPGAQP